MDNSIHPHELDKRQPGGLLISLKIFDGVLQWLASLIQLTEDEQKDAGIYLGRPDS